MTTRAEGDRSVAVSQATNAVIATGDHNVILNAGSDSGVLLELLRAAQSPSQRLRPVPIRSCPRAFGDRLDREAENAAVVERLNAGGSMNVYGAAGIGKTYIVRGAANDPSVRPRPEGVVFLNGKRLPLEDILQALFEEFFDCKPPFKPSGSSLRRDLRERQALVVIDAYELERDDVEDLMSALSGCALLIGSREQVVWEGVPYFVKGLATDDALMLVQRELARSLSASELEATRILCAALDGHPLRIKQVVAPVREGRMSLEDVARALANAAAPDIEGMRIALQGSSDEEREVLGVVAALNGATVSNEHIAALTGLADPTPAIERLADRSLVAMHSPRTSFLGVVPPDIKRRGTYPHSTNGCSSTSRSGPKRRGTGPMTVASRISKKRTRSSTRSGGQWQTIACPTRSASVARSKDPSAGPAGGVPGVRCSSTSTTPRHKSVIARQKHGHCINSEPGPSHSVTKTTRWGSSSEHCRSAMRSTTAPAFPPRATTSTSSRQPAHRRSFEGCFVRCARFRRLR